MISKISSNSIAGDNGVISALFSGYDKVTRPDFGKYMGTSWKISQSHLSNALLLIKNTNLTISDIKSCLKGNDFLTSFYPHSLVKGKPTTIFTSIYVESFGNIEEANMVCMLNCISLLKYEYGNTTPLLFTNRSISPNTLGNFCNPIERNR